MIDALHNQGRCPGWCRLVERVGGDQSPFGDNQGLARTGQLQVDDLTAGQAFGFGVEAPLAAGQIDL